MSERGIVFKLGWNPGFHYCTICSVFLIDGIWFLTNGILPLFHVSCQKKLLKILGYSAIYMYVCAFMHICMHVYSPKKSDDYDFTKVQI